MLTAIALDDEPPALAVIESFCETIPELNLLQTFTKPSQAQQYLNDHPVDLIFLDIHMPSIQGTDFYRNLQQPIMVVFTTAHSGYALEGFDLQAVDYLLKPYTYERFVQAVEKARELQAVRKLATSSEAFIAIKADYSLHRIALADICYVEGLDDYLKIYTHQAAKPIVTRMTLKSLLDKLPAQEFIRVHRSFIVAWKYIEKVRNRIIYIGSREIPIGTTYEETFRKHYS